MIPFLAVNPGWISVGLTATSILAAPLLLGIYRRMKGLFTRLDSQDEKLAQNERDARLRDKSIIDQLATMSAAQKDANGKVGRLQLDVALLQGTVYGPDALAKVAPAE